MAERIERGRQSVAEPGNPFGIYDLENQTCSAENGETISEETALLVDQYTTTAGIALQLNSHQPKNYGAIQETATGLEEKNTAVIVTRGLEIKNNLEVIKKENRRIESRLTQLHFLIPLDGLNDAPVENPLLTEHVEELHQLTQTQSSLQTQKNELEKTLGIAADLIVQDIRENNEDPLPILLEGRIGSALAGLGLYTEAKEHFLKAQRQMERWGMAVEGADFHLQALFAEKENGEDWETTAKQLEIFLEEADREVRLRESGPEGFGLWLASQGDVGSWRTLRAEALGGLLDLYGQNGILNNIDKINALTEKLTGILDRGREEKLSETEILALFDNLQIAQRWETLQAHKLGEEANKEALDPLSQKMEEQFALAQSLSRRYEKNPQIQESLGILEGLTYFHFWQKAGLPTKAVYNYFDHIQRSPNSEARQSLIKTVKQKAPHFFDSQGFLLPKNKVPFPEDSEEAAFAENSLHYDDAGFEESLLIGGGTSMGGATIGSLTGLLCGPFAKICVPAGAVIGGGGGYLAGDAIIDVRHSKERAEFVEDTKRAGLGLARLTLDEANDNEVTHAFSKMAGTSLSAVAALPAMKAGNAFVKGFHWLKQPVTWKWLGREIAYEGHYTLRWGKGLWAGIRGAVGMNGGATTKEASALTFEKVWPHLPPWQQARGIDYWRGVWETLRAPTADVIPISAANKFKTPLIDLLLEPLNNLWDNSVGQIARLGNNRLEAIRSAVLRNQPSLRYEANPLLAKKELLRLAYQMEKMNGAGAVNGKIGWEWFEKSAGWMKRNVTTREFGRAHRLATVPTVAGLFYDSDGKEGGGIRWDGEIDGGWEFWSFFFATNSLSRPLLDNGVVGADIAGAINLFTINRMLAMSHYEGETDYDRYRGAHLHYFAATAANSLFISGLHYLRRFPLGQVAGSIPFARRAPSMTGFPKAFRPRSSIDRPNFFTLPGLGLTLFYQGYLTGYQVSDVFSDRRLLNADPYYTWQRGTKYTTIVPPVNALQAAFGYRSTLGQTLGRVVAIPPDIGLAVLFPPFLDKGRHENKVRRLLEKETPEAQDEIWNTFVDTNTSLDLGGVVGRMVDVEHPISGPKTRRPVRIGHWRWEKRGVQTWTSPNPFYAGKDKKQKGLIEELADAGDHEKILGLVQTYRRQLLNPEAPWHEDGADQKGMVIFGFIAKYYAARAIAGERAFDPFLKLILEPRFASFFRALPIPKSHEELLDYVTQVDEGEFRWILQKAGAFNE